jgi:hypothetical protein
VSALALVGSCSPQTGALHAEPAPQRVTDLGVAVQRMVGLGITIRTGPTTRGSTADWDPTHRVVTLLPDTPISTVLWLLNDLWLLHTDPAHVSPSVSTPRLRSVQL